jgi:hypothetical protein
MLSQEDGISPFPCSKVESSSSREKAKMLLQEEVGRFPEGESLSFKSFIPTLLVVFHCGPLLIQGIIGYFPCQTIGRRRIVLRSIYPIVA